MIRPRKKPILVAAVSFVCFVLFTVLLAQRIVHYNKTEGRIVYAFMPINDRAFSFAGKDVRVEEVPADPAHPADMGSVRFVYGDDELVLPVTIPLNRYADEMPDLTRHNDWMRILRFAPVTGRRIADLEADMDAGKIPDRLVIATRSLRPGVNPETWGKVWRTDWLFDFYEFLPKGGFSHERFAYPLSHKPGEVGNGPHGEFLRGGIPELDSRSWEYQAADLLMPDGSTPRIAATDSPLIAAGWTLPAIVVSVFVMTGSLAFAFAPPRVGQSPDQIG